MSVCVSVFLVLGMLHTVIAELLHEKHAQRTTMGKKMKSSTHPRKLVITPHLPTYQPTVSFYFTVLHFSAYYLGVAQTE